MYIVHEILHDKSYLKNNTHSSLSRKSEETLMFSGFPKKKAYRQFWACSAVPNPWPATQFLLSTISCKFIVVDCKQGQLQCPRQALKGEFKKKLKEDSKFYEVFQTNV